MLLQWSIGFLLLLVADCTVHRTFCKGQPGTFNFTTKNYTSLDVKDSRGATIVQWKTPGNCFTGNSSLKLLETHKCNETDIVLTLEALTPEGAGIISLVRSGERSPLQSYNVTVTDFVSLNEYCSFNKDDRKLVCGDMEHLQNKSVQVKDAENKELLRHKGSYISYVFRNTEEGSFRVELDADPTCFRSFSFEVKSAQPSQPSQNAGWSWLLIGFVIAVVLLAAGGGLLYIIIRRRGKCFFERNKENTSSINLVQRSGTENMSYDDGHPPEQVPLNGHHRVGPDDPQASKENGVMSQQATLV